MSVIERVRAAFSRIDLEGHLDNAELTSDVATCSRLAPAFVELWAQVDDLFLWEPRRKGYAAALKRVHVALAALNEAAAREVGE